MPLDLCAGILKQDKNRKNIFLSIDLDSGSPVYDFCCFLLRKPLIVKGLRRASLRARISHDHTTLHIQGWIIGLPCRALICPNLSHLASKPYPPNPALVTATPHLTHWPAENSQRLVLPPGEILTAPISPPTWSNFS